MTRVVERCLTCGVEHEVRADACEACGGALRYWCRVHSRETGWLESPGCRGCAGEKARPAPRARSAPSAPKAAPHATPLPAPPERTPPASRRRTAAPERAPLQRRERLALLMSLGAMLFAILLISNIGQQNTIASEVGGKLAILLAMLIGVSPLFLGRSRR